MMSQVTNSLELMVVYDRLPQLGRFRRAQLSIRFCRCWRRWILLTSIWEYTIFASLCLCALINALKPRLYRVCFCHLDRCWRCKHILCNFALEFVVYLWEFSIQRALSCRSHQAWKLQLCFSHTTILFWSGAWNLSWRLSKRLEALVACPYQVWIVIMIKTTWSFDTIECDSIQNLYMMHVLCLS